MNIYLITKICDFKELNVKEQIPYASLQPRNFIYATINKFLPNIIWYIPILKGLRFVWDMRSKRWKVIFENVQLKRDHTSYNWYQFSIVSLRRNNLLVEKTQDQKNVLIHWQNCCPFGFKSITLKPNQHILLLLKIGMIVEYLLLVKWKHLFGEKGPLKVKIKCETINYC